ncbi:hypothetical protein [Sphingomonas hankyongi]|uniref:Uncharacterized protein n=1 Tax=Sphingomonas hankyongi TaxID=2908209 RepID=A0ABT0S127_9SPHN|nr:hypothetical protein [Sphingomonas hankyongi]MCL6729565.1 hypothetical protein [Sphingomonas hankyongi]
MKLMMKMLAGGAGLAALAAAAPAAAQYYQYGYSPYGYSNPYGYNGYSGYGAYGAYGMNTNAAAQQCSAAVQNRLANRTSIASILGSMVGLPTNMSGRVVSITSVTPHSSSVRVRGLASSGRYAYNNYGPYGVGAYGALGYNYQPDLSFSCTVDYRGYVRDVDLTRRY